MLLIYLVLFIAGCSEKQKNDVIKIGVSVSNLDDMYLKSLKKNIETQQNNLEKDVELLFMDAKMYPKKQEKQVKYLIDEGIDALIILPVDGKQTDGMTRMALNANIPIVYGNNYPDEMRDNKNLKNVYYVGSKEKNAGIIQMVHLAEKLGGKGDIAILMGSLKNSASFERTEGIEYIADRYPNINIVTKQSGRWLRPFGKSIVKHWLSSGVKFDAVVANNDEMAIGAIKALENNGKLSEVLVAGVDATDAALQELKNGKLYLTVLQDAKKQGEQLLKTAYKAANGETIRNEIWVPFKLVTRENYKSLLAE